MAFALPHKAAAWDLNYGTGDPYKVGLIFSPPYDTAERNMIGSGTVWSYTFTADADGTLSFKMKLYWKNNNESGSATYGENYSIAVNSADYIVANNTSDNEYYKVTGLKKRSKVSY